MYMNFYCFRRFGQISLLKVIFLKQQKTHYSMYFINNYLNPWIQIILLIKKYKQCIDNQLILQYLKSRTYMFSNQSTNDQVQTGKRILGMQQRKGQFNLKWDQGKNILNAYQQKKVKQVTQKPNYVQQKVKREGNDRRGVSPYQIPSNQFINPNQQIQVMGYLKKYQKIEEMPADELEKVMAYYDSLKQPKKGYQKQQEFETPSNQYIERRQPIKPKQTAGNIIYGSSQQSGTKPGSRYSQKTNTNSNAFVIGDGYNYFKQDKERKLEQQRLKSQNPNQYVPRNEFKQVSNLRLG